jgi:hypothetical protein
MSTRSSKSARERTKSRSGDWGSSERRSSGKASKTPKQKTKKYRSDETEESYTTDNKRSDSGRKISRLKKRIKELERKVSQLMEERRTEKKSDKKQAMASVQREPMQAQQPYYIDPDLLNSVTAPKQGAHHSTSAHRPAEGAGDRDWQGHRASSQRRSQNNSGRIVDFSDLRGKKK